MEDNIRWVLPDNINDELNLFFWFRFRPVILIMNEIFILKMMQSFHWHIKRRYYPERDIIPFDIKMMLLWGIVWVNLVWNTRVFQLIIIIFLFNFLCNDFDWLHFAVNWCNISKMQRSWAINPSQDKIWTNNCNIFENTSRVWMNQILLVRPTNISYALIRS